MILKTFVLGALEDNNYLLIDDNSADKEAVLIDCTEKCEEIEHVLRENNVKLKYILITHGHFDHILGVNYFKSKFPEVKVLMHEDDKELVETIKDFASRFMIEPVEVQHIDEYLKDDEKITFGNYEIKVIHTPGHTKGGACFLVGDKIFTGDTLFKESVGRVDLPGGSFDEIKSSIENKLFTLDEKIKVYPGHGPSSTIGHEKKNNNFL